MREEFVGYDQRMVDLAALTAWGQGEETDKAVQDIFCAWINGHLRTQPAALHNDILQAGSAYFRAIKRRLNEFVEASGGVDDHA